MQLPSFSPHTLARLLLLLLALLPLSVPLSAPSVAAPPQAAEGATTLYLPAVFRNFTLAPSIFGTEINWYLSGQMAPRAREANFSWSRYTSVRWSEVEPTPGARNWSQLDGEIEQITALAANRLTPLVVINGTPAWAQLEAGAACGPIKPEALDAFAAFMGEMAARYSRPPHNVHHWEFWNEPDVDPELVGGGSNSIYGCWGNDDDPYYGGGYYAEMLRRVYPAIKQADPSARVVVGGLLLDCDPANPPANQDCKPARFLEGILRNGGGAYFDVLAYHAYIHWTAGTTDWDLAHPNWAARGGALLGKLRFLREVMAQYGVDRPIMMNEGGLLCYPGTTCPPAELQSSQANYAVRLYSRAWANDLTGAFWYTLDGPGWREGGLFEANNTTPRPAYNTIKFLATRLMGGSYLGSESSGQREGYRFSAGGKVYRIFWMNDGSSTSVSLPAGSIVYNHQGGVIASGVSSANVTFSPIIVESSN